MTPKSKHSLSQRIQQLTGEELRAQGRIMIAMHWPQAPNSAASPSSFSISSSRLYLAMRSLRHIEPVFI